MKCVSCQRDLAKWEQPQPTIVLGRRCYPDALCDTCTKNNQTRALAELGKAGKP